MAKYDNGCLLSQNLTKEDFCGYSLKQITDIYLANYSQVGAELTTAEGTAISESGYVVSAITGDTAWYRIEPAKDSSSYNDDLVIGGNGSKYRTHTMTFSFNSAYNENVAKALDSFIEYAKQMKGKIGVISNSAQVQVTNFLSKVDEADQYLF